MKIVCKNTRVHKFFIIFVKFIGSFSIQVLGYTYTDIYRTILGHGRSHAKIKEREIDKREIKSV